MSSQDMELDNKFENCDMFTFPHAELSSGKKKILEALQNRCTQVADLQHQISAKSGISK